MITVKVNDRALRDALRKVKLSKRDFVDALYDGGLVVEAAAKRNIKLRDLIDTGDLRSSMTTEKNMSAGYVVVGTNKIYAAIHEFGGVIKPRTAKLLSWVQNGVRIFATSVTIPARPYLRPAIDDNHREIVNAVKRAAETIIKRAV